MNDELQNSSYAISVRDITVSFERKPVIWDLNFDIEKGSLVGLVGPNGAGKSTLFLAMLGLIPTTSGQVFYFGKQLSEIKSKVAYMPQRESIDWDFPISVEEVVLSGLYNTIGIGRRVRNEHRLKALEALDRIGISHLAKRQISQLSGGQQQRTFLARAIVQNADIYLMDEPFSAVDAATEKTIISILNEFKSEGKTSIVIHHDLHTVADYFTHVALLNMRLVGFGKTSEILSKENLQKTYGGKLTLLDEVLELMRHKEPRL